MSKIYDRLSRIGILRKSYTFKFLFVAFLGIHIPLIGLILFVLFRPGSFTVTSILVITLLLTLAATGSTLLILNGLLSPLRKSRQALDDYIKKGSVPDLPVHYSDEAGVLMQNIQFTVTELNDLLEEKKDLTALLSHDLRSPLHNIKTMSEFILQENEPETAKEYVGMIIHSAEDQIKLLENILSLLQQDHIVLSDIKREKVSIAQLVDETITPFATEASEKNISIRKYIGENGYIEVHPDLFKQVLRNLLSNAIKFSFPGAEIKIAVTKKDATITFDVIDTGLGFPPEIAEKLFDRFTKNGRKGTAGEASTGMGLYLSRKIVKRHKGDLVAMSAGPHMGSTFSVRLNT